MDNYIYTYFIFNDLFDIRINVYNDDRCELNFENEYNILSKEKKCVSLRFTCSKYNVVLSKEESIGHLVNKFEIERYLEESLKNKEFEYELSNIKKEAKNKLILLSDFLKDKLI